MATTETYGDYRTQVVEAPDTWLYKNTFFVFVIMDVEIVGANDTRTRWVEGGKHERLPWAIFASQATRYGSEETEEVAESIIDTIRANSKA